MSESRSNRGRTFGRSLPRGTRWRGASTTSRESWRRGNIYSPKTEEPPLGELIEFIDDIDLVLKDQRSVDKVAAKISECSGVTSYNWLSGSEAVLLVPGKPRRWTPPSETPELGEDSGRYFRDRNAARFPLYPMQPAVSALFNTELEFDLRDIDIVACSYTLGCLLHFALGTEDVKAFRILVQSVGETVFFVRRENSPEDTLEDVKGFGHTMPDAYTSWDADVDGSESHQRVIKYQLDDLHCLIRFGVDGFLEDFTSESKEKQKQSPSLSKDHQNTHDKPKDEPNNPPSQKPPLTVQKAGTLIPQATLFDIKTRTIKKKDHDILGEQTPRLWISQVPSLILAFHQDNKFEEIQILDVRERVHSWEHENQGALRKFVILIRKVIELARGRSGGVELRFLHLGRLEVRVPGGDVNSVLPDEVKSRWVGGD